MYDMSKKATPAQWQAITAVLNIMDIDEVDRQPHGAELPLSCTNPNARALVPVGPVRSIVEGGWTVCLFVLSLKSSSLMILGQMGKCVARLVNRLAKPLG